MKTVTIIRHEEAEYLYYKMLALNWDRTSDLTINSRTL